MRLIMPEIDDKELNLIKEVLDYGILTNDLKVKEFEDKIASYVGKKHAIAVSTGSAALHLAVLAAGIGEDDEIIIPAMAFPATVNALLFVKAKPVLVDININTLNIDPIYIEQKITSKTKAIMPVDLFGLPCDIDRINQIASKHNLIVIQDASYAFGSTYKGQPCGAKSDVVVFSFNERRVITCGEGGIVATNNQEIADKIRLFRNHAMHKEGKDQPAIFMGVGYNYRMSEIHAAVGLAQLDKLNGILEKRRKLGLEYNRIIEEMPNVTPPREPIDYTQNFGNYVIKLDVTLDTEHIKRKLGEREIPTTIGTYCIHQQPMYCSIEGIGHSYPVAEYAYSYGISLPITTKMNLDTIYYICEMLERFVV